MTKAEKLNKIEDFLVDDCLECVNNCLEDEPGADAELFRALQRLQAFGQGRRDQSFTWDED